MDHWIEEINYLIWFDLTLKCDANFDSALCWNLARSHDSLLCNIARSRLGAMQHSAESKLHSAESIKSTLGGVPQALKQHSSINSSIGKLSYNIQVKWKLFDSAQCFIARSRNSRHFSVEFLHEFEIELENILRCWSWA
jgi:hypothetical protein